MIIVVAGNMKQATDWAHTKNLAIHPGGQGPFAWIYASKHSLRGRQGGFFVRVGTWYERKDLEPIFRDLKIIGAKETDPNGWFASWGENDAAR